MNGLDLLLEVERNIEYKYENNIISFDTFIQLIVDVRIQIEKLIAEIMKIDSEHRQNISNS